MAMSSFQEEWPRGPILHPKSSWNTFFGRKSCFQIKRRWMWEFSLPHNLIAGWLPVTAGIGKSAPANEVPGILVSYLKTMLFPIQAGKATGSLVPRWGMWITRLQLLVSPTKIHQYLPNQRARKRAGCLAVTEPRGGTLQSWQWPSRWPGNSSCIIMMMLCYTKKQVYRDLIYSFSFDAICVYKNT